jgi:serine/threonine protein kinase
MIGTTISHYKILAQLGQGGMGVVFKAEDTRLKRPVALKFLSQDLTRDPEAKARFIHEARAASALDHPNIGAIYEIDQTPDGQIFIAMAFYDGLTLREKIGEANLLLTDCLDLAVQIAQGLAQAHKNRIVHRDIKPANIMITQEGLVKIVDFGLAKLGDGTKLTQVGVTMGTPVYMSPEQIRGQDVDHRSDIWAFGVVLFEMLTGQLPFRSETQPGVFYAVLNQDPPQVAQSKFVIPTELEQIIYKALQKKSENRYASMQAIVEELRRIQRQISRLQQRPISASQTQSDVISLLEKGKYYLDRRQYNEAVTRFKAALQLNPADRQARELITLCEAKQNEAEEVTKLLNTGRRYFEKGNLGEATKSFEQVIAIDPQQEEAREYLSRMQKLAEQAEQVEKQLLEADFYFKREKFEPAYEIYKKVLQLAPDNKEARRGLQKVEQALNAPKAETMRVMRTAPPKASKKFLWIGASAVALLAVAGIVLFAFLKPATEKPPAEEPKTPGIENQAKPQMPAVNWQASADSAKQVMQQVESAARREKAETLAAAAFQSARQTQRQGDNDYAAAKYQTAKNFYLLAASQFQGARTEARRRRDQQNTSIVAAQKQDAETARNQAAFKKRLVPANMRNTPAYQRAVAEENAGETQLRNGDYVAARRSFEQAQMFYAQAAKVTPAAPPEQKGETLALPGRLNVNAVFMENGQEKPAAAVVLINGQEKPEPTPLSFNLPAGQYRLSAKYFGYVLQDGEQVVTIRSGETTRYKFVFVRP